jgi:hypothetical protein
VSASAIALDGRKCWGRFAIACAHLLEARLDAKQVPGATASVRALAGSGRRDPTSTQRLRADSWASVRRAVCARTDAQLPLEAAVRPRIAGGHSFKPHPDPLLDRKQDRSWREHLETGIERWWRIVDERANLTADPMDPQLVFQELSPRLPNNCILTRRFGLGDNCWARPALRWALFEAAQCARRRTSPDHAYYQQAAERLGGNRVCLSIARKLLKRSYHTLRELGPEALQPH